MRLADKFDLFAIDVRALAVLRIGLGLLLFWDVCMRWGDAVMFYSDSGVLPVSAVLSEPWARWFFSLYFFNGEPWFAQLLLAVTGVCALLLALGWKTRWMTPVCWVLLLSLHNRNIWVLNNGDNLLRLLFFWSMFLPLGAIWSVDAKNGDRLEGKVFSIATVAILAQVAVMYACTAMLKTGDAWRVDGSAIADALQLNSHVKSAGLVLLEYARLLPLLSLGVFWLEALAVPLLFFPWQTARVRLVTVFMLTLLHLGIFVTLETGIFPWVSILALVLFLPLQKDSVSELRHHPVVAGVIGLMLLFVLVINFYGVTKPWHVLASVLRLDQKWAMFAPAPPKDDFWITLRWDYKDGRQQGSFSKASFDLIAVMKRIPVYSNVRAQKYDEFLVRQNDDDAYQRLTNYYCSKYSDLDTVFVYLHVRKAESPVRTAIRWHQRCPHKT